MGRKTESHGSFGGPGAPRSPTQGPERDLGDNLGGVIFGATHDTIQGATLLILPLLLLFLLLLLLLLLHCHHCYEMFDAFADNCSSGLQSRAECLENKLFGAVIV